MDEYIKVVEIPTSWLVMDMWMGNKTLAVKRLKISINTLNKKLQEYGIE